MSHPCALSVIGIQGSLTCVLCSFVSRDLSAFWKDLSLCLQIMMDHNDNLHQLSITRCNV